MSARRAAFVEFGCEGCGTHVVMFGHTDVPSNHYCLTCGYIEWTLKDNKAKQGMHEHLGTMRKLTLELP